MTEIQNEVTRIARNVANTLNVIESKGVSTAGANSDNMASLVAQIPQGGAVESVDGVAPDENGNVQLGAAKVDNYITELTADEFEALTEEERIALYAAGVRVLAVAKRSGDMTQTQMQGIADFLYPVGLVVELCVDTNPASLWGIGTWESYMPGRVLVGAGTADSGTVYTAGDVGGEEAHKLGSAELPKLSGTVTTMQGTSGAATSAGYGVFRQNPTGIFSVAGECMYLADSGKNIKPPSGSAYQRLDVNIGGDQPHNIMQPYGVVYRWLRVA